MVSRTLDSLLQEHFPDTFFNLLVIDVQGAELKVLRGADRLLCDAQAVFVEVCETPLYEGGCTLDKVSEFLRACDMHIRWLRLGESGMGDAFYIRQPANQEQPPVPEPNLATNRPASQSSYLPGVCNGSSQGAVSGEISGRFGFHTQLEDTPWWQVDLQEIRRIREIRVYNRGDMCQERSRNLVVLLSNDGTEWRKVHDQGGRIFGNQSEQTDPLRIFPNDAEARFVRIQLNGYEYLHLDQVEVY